MDSWLMSLNNAAEYPSEIAGAQDTKIKYNKGINNALVKLQNVYYH